MSRGRVTTLVVGVAAVVAIAVFLLARGGEGDSAPEKRANNQALADATALGNADAQDELERRSQALEDAGEKAGPKASDKKLDSIDRKGEAIDDLSWRAFDQQFRRTPFDKAIDALPLRKPPLDVVQWVTDTPPDKLRGKKQRERFYRMPARERGAAVKRFYRSGPHKLYARVKRERFFRMSPREREAAVQAFYRKARPFFEKAGIKDFVLVVTPWAETIGDLPALAVGRDGSAELTDLGRGDAFGS